MHQRVAAPIEERRGGLRRRVWLCLRLCLHRRRCWRHAHRTISAYKVFIELVIVVVDGRNDIRCTSTVATAATAATATTSPANDRRPPEQVLDGGADISRVQHHLIKTDTGVRVFDSSGNVILVEEERDTEDGLVEVERLLRAPEAAVGYDESHCGMGQHLEMWEPPQGSGTEGAVNLAERVVSVCVCVCVCELGDEGSCGAVLSHVACSQLEIH